MQITFIISLKVLTSYCGQARKTESSLQRIRQGAQRRAGASSDVTDNNVSDTDKICMQLFLDIQVWLYFKYPYISVLFVFLYLFSSYFSLWLLSDRYLLAGKYIAFDDMNIFLTYLHQEYAHSLALLGVDATKISAYRSLWQCVAPPDRKNVIACVLCRCTIFFVCEADLLFHCQFLGIGSKFVNRRWDTA